MADRDYIKEYLLEQLKSGVLILNEKGRIEYFNSMLTEYFSGVKTNSLLEEIFDEHIVSVINDIILESRNTDSKIKSEIEIKINGVPEKFSIKVTPVKDITTQFILQFDRVKDRFTEHGPDKIKVYTSEIEKLLKNKEILDLIDQLKSSFPFTFIEKARFQKEVNKLRDIFWLKDDKGKYIVVNDKLADKFGVKVSQIEGKFEQDFLPKYLSKLYYTLDAYIHETTNTVLIGGATSILKDEHKEIYEFPICDLDENVLALVGFSTDKTEGEIANEKENLSVLEKAISQFPEPVILTDKTLNIISYSKKFIDWLGLENPMNLIGTSVDKVLSPELFEKIKTYYENFQNKNDYGFNYNAEESSGTKFELNVSVSKIYEEDDSFAGLLIYLNKKENQSQILTKVKMYDVIMQTSPEAMFIYDIDNLKFLEVNDAALKLYGYKRGDFLNMDLTDLYAPEDIQTLLQSPDSKKTGSTFTGPWRHKKSDGTSILVELSKSTLEYKNKSAHFNIVRDVTEQIEKEKKLQLYKASFENSSDLIVSTDKDGFIQFINEPVTKKLGYSKKDLENRPFLSLVGDADRANINKDIFHSGKKGTNTVKVELKKVSGEVVKCNITATPVTDFSGDIESFSLILKMPEEKKKEKSVVDTEQVERSGEVDPQFLSMVFHEVLTPINVVIGFAQELWESIQNPSEEQKEAIDYIRENQKMLVQIMDNAIEYSSLEQKVVKIKPEDIVFSEMIEELEDNTKKFADANNVDFSYGKISSSLSFETDAQKLMTLMTLFIRFAIQITKEKAVYLSAYKIDEERCIISVKDKRTGISDYLLKAFKEIFAQDENAIRKNYGFSRFSVRLAKKIIHLLSAKQEVLLKSGEPVEFGFIFPKKFKFIEDEHFELESTVKEKETPKEEPVEEEKKDKEEIKSPEAKRKTKTEEKPAPKPKRGKLDLANMSCLYLEDQIDSQMLFKVQMKDLRETKFAPSFEEALPLLKGQKFDFIMMDINLQGEYNGLDALRIIQKMPGYEDIPVIAVTAYVLPGDKENFIAAGFTDFVSKPLLRDKITDTLKEIYE